MRSIFVLLLLAATFPLRAECTGERWPVKAAADVDAASVSALALPATIEYLHSLPSTRPLPHDERVTPIELTPYTVTATLTDYRRKEDGAIELVLSDAAGRTLLAELPSQDCANRGRFSGEIDAARRALEASFPPQRAWQKAMVPIEIRGVAYFDFLRGQHGGSPNGIALAPVTSVNLRFVLPSPIPPKSGSRRRAVGAHLPRCVAPSLQFQLDKPSACADESVVLRWQAGDPLARVTLDGIGENLPAVGSTIVGASASSVYSGHATNACGVGSEAVTVLNVRPPAHASLQGPSTIQRNAVGTLVLSLDNLSTWTLTSSLGNAIIPSSGTQSSGTSAYMADTLGSDRVTLHAAGGCGPLTRYITIVVSAPSTTPPSQPPPSQPPPPPPPPPPTGLRCCDGTYSSTCRDCSNKRGCCSGHGGVASCPGSNCN